MSEAEGDSNFKPPWSRGSGMEITQTQAKRVPVSDFLPRTTLGSCYSQIASEVDKSEIVHHTHPAAKGHTMFLPKLTNEMCINWRDRMAPTISYERTHRRQGRSISPNWPQITASDIRDGAWTPTSQSSMCKKGSRGEHRACNPVRLRPSRRWMNLSCQ